MYKFTTFISKRVAEQVRINTLSSTSILVSLNSPQGTVGSFTPNLNEAAWSKIMRLEFHDADANYHSIDNRIAELAATNQISLFTEQQAIEILGFLKEHQDTHDNAIVHCEGGISRSAAVSKFIAQIYKLDFNDSYSLYNRLVYSTLLRVHTQSAFGDGPIKPEDLPGVF